MKPRINIITLGTKNLSLATKFYKEGLGFPKMDFEGNVSFFLRSMAVGYLSTHGIY